MVKGIRRVYDKEDELVFSAFNELAQMGIEQYRSGECEKAVDTLTSVEKFRLAMRRTYRKLHSLL